MGNCFKCFEKQEDEDQLINDEDGECFLRRKQSKNVITGGCENSAFYSSIFNSSIYSKLEKVKK